MKLVFIESTVFSGRDYRAGAVFDLTGASTDQKRQAVYLAAIGKGRIVDAVVSASGGMENLQNKAVGSEKIMRKNVPGKSR